MRAAPVAPALAILLLAGCVTPDPGTADGAGAAGVFLDPIVEDHDHTVLEDHALQTATMELLGYTAMGDASTSFTGLGEMDLFLRGEQLLAAVSAVVLGGQGAVVLVDVTDPQNMQRLGFATLPDASHPLDVKWDEKGEFVYASTNARLFAIDARDPTAPAVGGASISTGLACHMTAMGTIGGDEYLFCTGDGLWMSVYQVVAAGDKRTLAPVGQWKPTDPPSGNPGPASLGAPHDMTFQLDPVDQKPILAVSGRGYGLRVLDVSDPRTPREMAKWTGEGADLPPIHMHTGMVAVIDGTRYLIGSPEILPDDETPPAVWVLDATDYADLKLVGEWTAPGDHGSPGFTFTTHQWQIADGRIYLGYYHAGVWVLDVRAILAGGYRDDPARPEVLGYYLPHEAPTVDEAMVPNVWDVTLHKGVIYVTDISSGLYALHYLPDTVGDASLTGFS